MNLIDLTALSGLLLAAIEEDVGSGDVTSRAVVPESATALGQYVAKQGLVVCGLSIAAEVVHLTDSDLQFRPVSSDGAQVERGAILAEVQGNARSILTAERTSLNFLQRLSGIATSTKNYVARVAGTSAQIMDTRKTVPGMRLLDKYAVRCGGGVNHRIGLFDAVLVKNNHLVFHPGVGEAIRATRNQVGDQMKTEVEVRNLAELQEGIDSGVDMILLDNFSPEETRQAVELVSGRVTLESSGGITLDNVRSFAEAGVDYISVGALTHSVAAADIHLRVTPN